MRTFQQTGLVFVCLIGLGLTLGCATISETGDMTSDDLAIQRNITERLQQDAMPGSHGIRVRVSRGEATLYGIASDESARMRAISIAEATPGVRRVQDATH